jgi:hypothetical protein
MRVSNMAATVATRGIVHDRLITMGSVLGTRYLVHDRDMMKREPPSTNRRLPLATSKQSSFSSKNSHFAESASSSILDCGQLQTFEKWGLDVQEGRPNQPPNCFCIRCATECAPISASAERDNIRFNHEVHACPKAPDAGSVSSMELCPKEVSLTSHSQQVLGVLVLKGNFR